MGMYFKKPVAIEARRLAGTAAEMHDVMSWMENNGYPFLIGDATQPETLRYPDQPPLDKNRPTRGIYIDPATGNLMIRTLEGDMAAKQGDWIIRGIAGEFYPCRPDIFRASYEEVGEGNA